MIKSYIELFPQWPGAATGTPVTNVSADGASMEYYQFASYDQAVLTVEVSAAAGSAPVLNLFVDERNQSTGNWAQIDAFAPLTGTTAAPVRRVLNAAAVPASYPASGAGGATDGTLTPFGECLRLRWTVGGSNPNFTFTCGAVLITGDAPSGTA